MINLSEETMITQNSKRLCTAIVDIHQEYSDENKKENPVFYDINRVKNEVFG